jgi:DNA-directed RNA polymerase subunit N (RpoN/RPB10)
LVFPDRGLLCGQGLAKKYQTTSQTTVADLMVEICNRDLTIAQQNCCQRTRDGQNIIPLPDIIFSCPRDVHEFRLYEVVSKIFRTGAAIYTAVVVARSTGPNRPNCEFRVLLRLLQRLRENVRRRRSKLWREQTWLLHHDNAPSHTSVITQQFLAKY